jgi:hypothetical protein
MDRMHQGPIALLVLACAAPLHAAEVVRVAPWELHSSFWMSLHQTLMSDAMRTTPRDVASLSPGERTAWDEAIEAYRTAGGRGDITFARPMLIVNDAISQVADDAVSPPMDAPLAHALARAAPVYRAHWWTADDRANRFLIAYAAAMLRDGGDSLRQAHEAVYRTPWPTLVRVYVAPYAGPFGAYTMTGLSGGVITTMSSQDAGYQGHRALEMLLHESAHAVVTPASGTVATAIAASAKARGVAVPRDLWHAILFATSSELTRRHLAERGVRAYEPSSVDLFTRVWPSYRGALERHWIPYVNGQGTLEDAIDRVIVSIQP